jgi:preprotein translocase subunit SecA
VVEQGVGSFRRILEAVNQHEGEFRGLSSGALSKRAVELRRRLGIEGLVQENVGLTFALVRELADRTLGMRPYDVQLIGGWVMLHGMIAEMQTGEGKTLAATLPASAAALCGIPVHVVTVNDYLVTRDAEWARPLYQSLGLSVGSITEGMEHEDRRRAYACDVTYCANKQVVFDYLRDRLVLGERVGRLQLQLEGLLANEPRSDRLLMRGLCCAIVDEADSVLIDEARTPLIISAGGSSEDQARIYEEALEVTRLLTEREHFARREHEIELTDRGRERLRELAEPIGGVWTAERRREELGRLALSALYLFERDRHYLVKDDKVQIIDEYTGRLMPDRSWERGLHQLIEVKEGCKITEQRDTLARISYQRYFRRYLLLCGMTGTAKEVAGELWSVYRLGVVTVPTRLPLRRERQPSRVFRSAAQRWHAVVARIGELRAGGRPVLVGTRSVGASERLSGLLAQAGVPHQVLNARQDKREAEIVAEAGQIGRVTVATNMAGRGTDIKLAPGTEALGGLHVIATERHDAGRIDRQLFGRCGRQGDPGSFEFIVSLEDELVESFYPRFFIRWLRSTAGRTGPLRRWLGEAIVALPQRAAEMRHARARRSLLKLDEHLGDLLAFSGRPE